MLDRMIRILKKIAHNFSSCLSQLLLMVTTSPAHEFSVTRNTMNLGVSLTCTWMVHFLRTGVTRPYGLFNPRPYALKVRSRHNLAFVRTATNMDEPHEPAVCF